MQNTFGINRGSQNRFSVGFNKIHSITKVVIIEKLFKLVKITNVIKLRLMVESYSGKLLELKGDYAGLSGKSL